MPSHPARAPPGRRFIKGQFYAETDGSQQRSIDPTIRLHGQRPPINSMGIIAYLYIAGGTAAPANSMVGQQTAGVHVHEDLATN